MWALKVLKFEQRGKKEPTARKKKRKNVWGKLSLHRARGANANAKETI